jgi:hypothetical protein
MALERFITTGIDEETHAAIGHLPRGSGILGVLISDARTLRLHDLGKDPRSVGSLQTPAASRLSSSTATTTSGRRTAAR